MEEQDRIEAKRAKNFIWSAAQCYDFEPLFLAFSLDGTADIYLNLIIGLCYKWYNREKMEEFFEMLNGKNQETLEGLFWIGLDITDQKKRKEQINQQKTIACNCSPLFRRRITAPVNSIKDDAINCRQNALQQDYIPKGQAQSVTEQPIPGQSKGKGIQKRKQQYHQNIDQLHHNRASSLSFLNR